MENLKVLKTKSSTKTIIKIKDVTIGDGSFVLIAGPCSIEDYKSLDKMGALISKNGGKVIRGGAFKLRTSPYSFQGLGTEGLIDLYKVGQKYNLVTISELTDLSNLDDYLKYIDIIQVGARNMNNYEMLKKLGTIRKPILLKRGPDATIYEWLYAAEYLLSAGNKEVILCERGIRTFETYTRNTLDLSAVLAIKELSHLPIFVDPSHGTGRSEMVVPLVMASKVIGADGAMVEIAEVPEKALSDGKQAINFSEYVEMMKKIWIK